MRVPLARLCQAMGFLALAALPAGSASAASLDADTCLDAATQTGISLDGGTQIVATNAAGVYDFGDRNGDGTRNDPVTNSGLGLGSFRLYTDDAGSASYIEGLITVTNGLPASGLGNIGTRLRAPAGKAIFYVPKQNPGLGGRKVTLANLAGTAGAGGYLAPPPSGTVVWFK